MFNDHVHASQWGFKAVVTAYSSNVSVLASPHSGAVATMEPLFEQTISSPHPYLDNMNLTQKLDCKSCDFIVITFSSQCHTETDHDLLSIMTIGQPPASSLASPSLSSTSLPSPSASSPLFPKLSGPPERWPVTLSARSCSSIEVCFTSDASGVAWGYDLVVRGYRVSSATSGQLSDPLKETCFMLAEVERTLSFFIGCLPARVITLPMQPAVDSPVSDKRPLLSVIDDCWPLFAGGLQEKTDSRQGFVHADPTTQVVDADVGASLMPTSPHIGSSPLRSHPQQGSEGNQISSASFITSLLGLSSSSCSELTNVFLSLMMQWARSTNHVTGGPSITLTHGSCQAIPAITAALLYHHGLAQTALDYSIDVLKKGGMSLLSPDSSSALSTELLPMKSIVDLWRVAISTQRTVFMNKGQLGVSYEEICIPLSERARFTVETLLPAISEQEYATHAALRKGRARENEHISASQESHLSRRHTSSNPRGFSSSLSSEQSYD